MYNVKSEFKQMFSNNKQIKAILLIFSMIFFASSSYSQQEGTTTDTVFNKKISNAVLSSDISALSELFHNKVDLVLPEESGIYSKRQAVYILKEFFNKNKPKTFNLVTENTTKGSVFIVGKLQTDKQKFRTCFLTKKEDNKVLIYQIRIEK